MVRRLGVVLVSIVVMWGLAGCTFGKSSQAASSVSSPLTQVEAVVSDDGFMITLGDITVSGLPGVAPVGTHVTVSWIDDPDAGFIADLQGIESGPPVFGVSMEEGRQPLSPITVSWAITQGKEDTPGLAFATRNSETGLWSGLPVAVDDGRAYVSLDHLSWGWFGWGEQVVDWLTDQFQQSMDMTFDKPDCAGQPMVINGAQWTVTTDHDGVYPCLEEINSQVGVTLHSANGLTWFYRPTAGDAAALQGNPPSQIGPMLAQAAWGVKQGASIAAETVLVSGGTASIVLNPGVTHSILQAEADVGRTTFTGLGIVDTLFSSVDAVLGLTQAGSLPIDQTQPLEDTSGCLSTFLQSYMPFEAQINEVVSASFGCASHLLTNQTSFVVSVLVSLLKPVVAGIQSAISSYPDTDLVTLTIDTPSASGTSIFAQLPETFRFASGVGGWWTEIHIGADGTFTGYYFDGDIDVVYESHFSGTFTVASQVSEYEYSLQLADLQTEGTVGEERIENGQRYITADPYGFDDASAFSLYLPGRATDDLPQPFLQWIVGGVFPTGRISSTLPCWGLYNIDGQKGFYSV